jgi:hypothetical protein
MSNEGSRAYYLVLDKIKDQLLADPNVNKVTRGEIADIDLDKQTMYPLSHILINNTSFSDNIITFNISVISMDIVDSSKERASDLFDGNDNEADVLNSQLLVQNRLYQELKRGTIYTDQYQIVGDPSCEPFTDRFANKVAGWAMTMDVITKNNVKLPSCD